MNNENELLEAALKLAESIRPYSLSEEERTLIEVIEQHRPKPKRLEGWINFYDDSTGIKWRDQIWSPSKIVKCQI